MPHPRGLPKTLRGRRDEIVDLLRRAPATANELAERLGVTHNAVRSHLSVLQQEGLVRQARLQPGASRPSVVYELAPEADATFSSAYAPFLAQLVRVLRERLSRRALDSLMRDVGRRLAATWPRPRGDLAQRVHAASELLDELGAPNEVERRRKGFAIQSYGCMLSEAVDGEPEVCHALESLLSELVEAPVRERCDRSERPRCCFEIDAERGRAPTPAARE